MTFVIVSLLGAVLGALLNPHFGLNRTALATFIATLLAILAGLSVSTAVNVGYRRVRHRNFEARLHALPAGLVIAIGCVLMSRLADFQPGYLYGIVCGVAFTPLARDEEGHIVALDVGAVLAIAVLAWLIRIPVDHAAVRANASFWVITLDDLLAALVVSSLVGSVLSLFPLRFLPGAKLAAWRRRRVGGRVRSRGVRTDRGHPASGRSRRAPRSCAGGHRDPVVRRVRRRLRGVRRVLLPAQTPGPGLTGPATPERMLIRPALPADADDVAGVHVRSWQAGYPASSPTPISMLFVRKIAPAATPSARPTRTLRRPSLRSTTARICGFATTAPARRRHGGNRRAPCPLRRSGRGERVPGGRS